MLTQDEVFERLQEARGHWPEIARDTGLDYSWLTKFGQGRIRFPRSLFIERLAAHPLIASNGKQRKSSS